MALPIPTFYHVAFTIVDPALALLGMVGNIFSGEAIVKSYTPSAVTPPAPETTFLLQTGAGFLSATLYLQLYLLRARPADVLVWRAVQASTAIVDVFMLGGIANILAREGRLSIGAWTSGDWTNIVITSAVLIERIAFLLGVGFAKPSVSARTA